MKKLTTMNDLLRNMKVHGSIGAFTKPVDGEKKTSGTIGTLIAIVLFVALTTAGIVAVKDYSRKEAVYAQYAAEWDKTDSAGAAYYMVMDDNGEYLLITDVNESNVALGYNKDWVEQGLEECLKGEDTELARTAAKYHTLKGSDNKKEIIALGTGYFMNPDRMDEVQATRCHQSLVWHMVN